MKPLRCGDKVMVVGPVPVVITQMTGVYGGEIGEVIRVCTCIQGAPEWFLRAFGPGGIFRIHFADSGKTCLPRRLIRKIEDDGEDDDKKVDWNKIPKPWQIGVTG
jgi:hypothetical protein